MKKRTYQLQIDFATKAGLLATLEGEVSYQAGDAIVTGLHGEQWPVPRADFEKKYQPLAPNTMGKSGSYQTLPTEVLAIQLEQEIDLLLAEKRGALHGQPGDWLLQYETGGQAIIAADIFNDSYEAADDLLPLMVGVAGNFNQPLIKLCEQIQIAAGLTPVLFLQSDGMSDCSLWKFNGTELVLTELHRHQFTEPLFRSGPANHTEQLAAFLLKNTSMLLTATQLADTFYLAIQHYSEHLPFWAKHGNDSDQESSLKDLFTLPQVATIIDQSQLERWLNSHRLNQHSKRGLNGRISHWQQVKKMLPDLKAIWHGLNLASPHENHEAEQFQALSEQITELRLFNQEISEQTRSVKHTAIDPNLSMHLLADKLAGTNQDSWQALVFSTTKRIACTGGLIYSIRNAYFGSYLSELGQRLYSLFGLGLMAALSFAAFTEIGGGCEPEDWFAFSGCSNSLWKHWAGGVFFGTYLAILLLALFRYERAKQAEYERKHQDYRLLAEALRVQYCWNLSGCRAAVADALPASDQEDNRWVRNGLRAFNFIQLGSYAEPEEQRLHCFSKAFIEHQKTYHTDTLLKRREKVIHFMSARARIGLIYFQIFVALIACNTGLALSGNESLEGMAHHALILGMLFSLGWWAANKKVIDTFGLESEVRRGKSVLETLNKATRSIEQFSSQQHTVHTARQVEEFIFEVGRIFVSDQANWHTLHRERPVEAATGA